MQNEKKQHKVFVVGFSLIALLIFGFLLKPFVSEWKNREKNSEEQRASAEILKAPSIVPEDLLKKNQKKSKVFLVDVSAPDDFKRGHIETAVNVPAEKLDKNFFKSLGADGTADIFLMNQGSDLAALAETVNKIVSAGFANAKYLRGGIADWKQKGYPLVSSGGSEVDAAKVKKITISEIRQESETNPELLQFLDVRGKDAFAKEHVVGAINIPLSEIEGRKKEIPAIKKIIVYGASREDSFQAAVTLFDLNFFNIYQMQESLADWKAADGKVESGN